MIRNTDQRTGDTPDDRHHHAGRPCARTRDRPAGAGYHDHPGHHSGNDAAGHGGCDPGDSHSRAGSGSGSCPGPR